MEYESITDFLFEGNSPDVLTEEQRYDFLLEYFEEEYLEDLNEEELGELYELVEDIVMKAISKNEFYNRVYGIVQEIAEAADEGFVKSKLAKKADEDSVDEAHQSYTDPKSKEDLAAGKADAGFAGPGARRAGGGGRGAQGIGSRRTRDRKLRKDAKKAGERLEKKVPGARASRVSSANLYQMARNAERRKNAGNNSGNDGNDRNASRAEGELDKKKRAGDQG